MRRLLLRAPLLTTAAGIALGLPAAYWATHAMAFLLFGVAPLDPFTAASSAALLIGITTLAALSPARPAAAIAPQECLKTR